MIVKWYVEIMEGGVDTKQMMHYYSTAKERIDNLAQAHSRELLAKEKENNRLKNQLAKTQKKLQKLFNDCLKPLLAEVKLKD